MKAKDRATGKEQQVRITASSMLDKSAVDQMVRDAQEHADEDKTAARRGRDPQPGRGPHVPGRADHQGSRRQGRRPRTSSKSRTRSSPCARRSRAPTWRRSRAGMTLARRDAQPRLDRGLPGRCRGGGRVRQRRVRRRIRRDRRCRRRLGRRRSAGPEAEAEGAERGDGRGRVQGGLGPEGVLAMSFDVAAEAYDRFDRADTPRRCHASAGRSDRRHARPAGPRRRLWPGRVDR